jgi:hypothetical protein
MRIYKIHFTARKDALNGHYRSVTILFNYVYQSKVHFIALLTNIHNYIYGEFRFNQSKLYIKWELDR